MKIAIIHPDFNIKGGAENVIYWLCEDLAGRPGTTVAVFSADFADWELKFKKIPGLSVNKIYVPKIFKNSRLARLLFAPLFLKKNLKNFDAVNPHNYPASLWTGIANILSRGKLSKIVWSCNEPTRFLYKKICNSRTPENLQVLHRELNDDLTVKTKSKIKFVLKSFYKPFLRYLDKKAVRSFSKILTLSDFVGGQVKKIYGTENIFTCYAGIKSAKKSNFPAGAGAGQFFLTVSRLEGCKNIQKIIEAFYALRRQDKLRGVGYYIVGQGPFEKHLKNLIEKSGLNDRIKMPGYVNVSTLFSYYENCLSVIYLPFDEPFGLPYLEAASFSKPSIASNHGGPSELVVHGKTGFLADPSDAGGIAQSIEKMYEDKNLREEMGRNAHDRLNKNFLWEKYRERLLQHLES